LGQKGFLGKNLAAVGVKARGLVPALVVVSPGNGAMGLVQTGGTTKGLNSKDTAGKSHEMYPVFEN